MPHIEIIIKDVAQHIFNKRRFEVIDPVYDKLLEDVVLDIKEKAHDLTIAEMKNHTIKFDENLTPVENEEKKSDIILELQQLMHEELVRNLTRDL